MKTYKLCEGDTVIQELKTPEKEDLKNYLKSGTKIRFKMPPKFDGIEGEVVGLSFTPTPSLGAHYIIKLNDPSKINQETYPYDYLCAYRRMFDVI
jgi:hypothetical protein